MLIEEDVHKSCRWKYRLFEKDRQLNDDMHLFSMSSKDLMGADYVADLIEAGVASLKIEGRMKKCLLYCDTCKSVSLAD